MEILRNTNIDFMKYRKFWIIVSLALVVLGIVSVFFLRNLNVGVDFAGGTQINLQFRERPDLDRLRGVLERSGLEQAQILRFGDEEENEVMVRTSVVGGAVEESIRGVVTALDRELNPPHPGKPDINRIGADALGAVLAQADPDHLGPGGAPRYLKTAEEILKQRKKDGLFNSWNDLAGLGGLSPAGQQALQQRT